MSASRSDKILELKRLLADRFGESEIADEAVFHTGLPTLDGIGVPKGALSELVGSGPGSTLLLHALLHAMLGRNERAILIDGKTGFAPTSLPQAELNRLLWVRCRNAGEAIKAADLAVRDGNLPLVVMLLSLNSASELRRISATAWHRLNVMAEKSGVALLVFTPQAQIGCARLRVLVGGAFPLERLHLLRSELIADVEVKVQRRRVGRRHDEELRDVACA